MDPLAQAAQQSQNPQPTPEDQLAATDQALIKKKKIADQEQNNYDPAQISQAMAQVDPKSPSGQVGKAIQTPAYAGLCLKWVDDQQGNQNRLPTAFADYQARSQAGAINTSDKIQPGARVYFAPDASNGNMGHVGIAGKDNTFTSATDNGIKTFSIKEWEKYTGQRFIGSSK